jgi:hypothetical protein
MKSWWQISLGCPPGYQCRFCCAIGDTVKNITHKPDCIKAELTALKQQMETMIIQRDEAWEDNLTLKERLAEAESRLAAIKEDKVDTWMTVAGDLTKRIAEAEELLQWVMSPDFYNKNRLRRDIPIQAFLSHAPSGYATVDEYACLQVLKSSMPPNASLVICYDAGDGAPRIQDEMYEGYVVVRRDQAEQILSALEEGTIEHINLKAALDLGQEIPEPETKP